VAARMRLSRSRATGLMPADHECGASSRPPAVAAGPRHGPAATAGRERHSRSPGSTATGWYGRPLGCLHSWYSCKRIQPA
jgi:hypothetical protein